MAKKLIGPFRQLLTLRGLAIKGPIKDEDLEVIQEAGILLEDGLIIAIDIFSKLKNIAEEVTLLEEDYVVLPGLIDAHTHLCFAGSRAMDFAARNAGQTYLEIAKAGGGIWSTVKHTREASFENLVNNCLHRLDRQISNGVTTSEVKSGYGLGLEEELKILRAINQAKELHPSHVIPTCLAAHIVPKDFNGGEEAYLQMILREMLPKIKNEKLCKRFDIFIEDSAFGTETSYQFLRQLKESNIDITVHGDQFTTGGSKVAVDVGALSVDHLEVSTEKEITMLAKSNTTAIALPGASLGIGCGFTPVRKLLDAGASLAIASDWNPGSAPQGNLVAQAAILSSYEKLSAAEVFAALSFRAANALGLQDRGSLDHGKRADFILFPIKDYREILYHHGELKPSSVYIGGEIASAGTKKYV